MFAAGNDDLRPVMSGIYFEFYPDSVRFVATDAHKLVRYTRNDAKAGASASFIMPKKPLNVLKNLLSPVQNQYDFIIIDCFISCVSVIVEINESL